MPRTFTLVRTLGRGAHGAVHLAQMRDDDEYVQTLAVKRLLPEWSTDPDLVARLKDEARLLALLHHEHVVRVHGLSRIDGALAILMEPVDGVDLGRAVELHGALAPRVTLEIVRAVADALDAAWTTAPPGRDALRVVHRDIKPSNVMLTARGGVKVMDFGVARATFEAREGETRSQQFGTARYMAPERWLDGVAEHRSDVFSLGVTLIEIASAQPVPRFRLSPEGFVEDARQAVETLADAGLRELARQMTAFAAQDRPSGAELMRACDALLETAGGPALRVWAAENVRPEVGEPVDPTRTVTVVREDTSNRSSPTAPAPSDGRSWLGLLIGLGGVGATIGIGSWISAGGFRPVPPPLEADVEVSPVEVQRAPIPERVTAQPVGPPAEAPGRSKVIPPKLGTVDRPAPAPVEPSAPRVAAPTVAFRFFLDDAALAAETDFGRVLRSPAVLQLPANSVVEVRVTEDGRETRCYVNVGAHAGEVRIRKGGACTQSS